MGDNPKILCVDDEVDILKSLNRMLVYEDVEVLTAGSGVDGIKLLAANRDTAAIISDYNMPGITGLEFLEKARQIAPDAVRIVLTGYADKAVAIAAINKAGAHRFLTKPWQESELLTTILDACKEHQARKVKDPARLLGEKVDVRRLLYTVKEMHKRCEEGLQNTVSVLGGILDLWGHDLRTHSSNVAEISLKVVTELKLPGQQAHQITLAAALHDIGKMGLPGNLTNKTLAELDREQVPVYTQHPVRGQVVLDFIGDMQEVGTLIRGHHEHYDGTGFPDRLSRDQIPLGSRIIAIADWLDRTMARTQNLGETTELFRRKGKGRLLDHTLCPRFEAHLPLLWRKHVQPRLDVPEKEVVPKNLVPGMVLSRDLVGDTHITVFKRGKVLDLPSIEKINRYYRIDSPGTGVYVWTGES